MALNALGSKITSALSRLTRSTTADEELFKSVLKDICNALMEADVNLNTVVAIRKRVMEKVNLEGDDDGGKAYSKAHILEKAVVEELVHMLDPGRAPFKPAKGKA